MTDRAARHEIFSVNANDASPRRLGRGLGALLGESRREEIIATPVTASMSGSGLASLAVTSIERHPEQPRRHFDETALEELAASIAARGVIQPVIVRPLMVGGKPSGRYQLVAGERRWRAAQRAQLHEIPAIVRELSEREVMALALIENLQREDLNPIEEARAYHRLAEVEGLTQTEIAQMVDKSRSHVANLQRLLSLPEEVIVLVEIGSLSMGHARALIGVKEAEELARQAVARQLSVREVERLARRKSPESDLGKDVTPHHARNSSLTEDTDIIAVQKHLEEFLGLPVKISSSSNPRAGSISINYRTLDQLDLICSRLTGGVI